MIEIFNTDDEISMLYENSPLKIVEYLLDNDIMLKSNNTKYCKKPIHYIFGYYYNTDYKQVFNSTPERLKYFIDKGKDLECEDDNEGMRPLHLLCIGNSADIIKYAIDKGMDLESETKSKYRPIDYAIDDLLVDIVKYMIEKGVKLNSLTLYKAIQWSTPEIVKLIIYKGVDLESMDEDYDNFRAIHFAIVYKPNNLEIIKSIVEKGVELECEDTNEMRPMHYACEKSTQEIINYFREKGVDMNCKDKSGKTPIDYLVERIK